MRNSLLMLSCLALVFALSCSRESGMNTSEKENGQAAGQSPAAPAWLKGAVAKLEGDLVKQYGETQRARLQRGLKQVSEFWRASDGDQATFEEFVQKNFA